MKIKTYKCINCGYEKQSEEEDLSCPICSGLMQEKIDIQGLIDLYFEQSIKRDINFLGNDRVYQIIESFSSPETRIRYRKIFLKYGGTIPKTEV